MPVYPGAFLISAISDISWGLSSGRPPGCSRRRWCRAGRCCGGIRMALVTWCPSDELIRTKMLPHEVSRTTAAGISLAQIGPEGQFRPDKGDEMTKFMVLYRSPA